MGVCTASRGGSEGTCTRSPVSSGRVLSLVSTTITIAQVLPLGIPSPRAISLHWMGGGVTGFWIKAKVVGMEGKV